MNDPEIFRMSAAEMAASIKSKRLSPVEVTEAILQRIEQQNPKINAYCTIVADQAREQARKAETMVVRRESLGALHGVPVSIKDSIYTKGIRSTIGSKLYQDFVPQEDAVVVERLKRAGAIVLGKTNTPEFCLLGVTDNRLFGVTRNPWNRDFTPGGSSGGAAAAVAAGLCPIAIGSDGGGSIRIPSSFCGVFGLKPSYGRVPQYPNFPGWDTTGLITTGLMTRTVRDAALVMGIIAGRDDKDRDSLPERGLKYVSHLSTDLRGLKVAWSQNLGYAKIDPRVLRLTKSAVKVFETLGCTVEPADPKGKSLLAAYYTIVGVSHAAVLREKVQKHRDQMHPSVAFFVEGNEDRLATDYLKARLEQANYWNAVRPFLKSMTCC